MAKAAPVVEHRSRACATSRGITARLVSYRDADGGSGPSSYPSARTDGHETGLQLRVSRRRLRRGSRLGGLRGGCLPRPSSRRPSSRRPELGFQRIGTLLVRFRRLYRFHKRSMKTAKPVAGGRTRFLSVHGAARVDAVAEQRIAHAPLRVLIFDYEFVEVPSHPVPLSAQTSSARAALPNRHGAKRRKETRARSQPLRRPAARHHGTRTPGHRGG
jgi:hypothetical protein